MAGVIDKRKRGSEEDFHCDSDSTPLSKRIKNLHLTNFEESSTSSVSEINQNLNLQQQQQQQHHSHNQAHHMQQHLVHQQNYNPELDEHQNPYYYLKNKLLHDLHIERLKRCTI